MTQSKTNLYKGTFNWYGEIHVLHTRAKDERKAWGNFITRLAKSLDRTRGSVILHLIMPHRWEIKEVKDG